MSSTHEIELALAVSRTANELIAKVIANPDHDYCQHCLGMGVEVFRLAMARVYADHEPSSANQALLLAAEQHFTDLLNGMTPTPES